MHSAEDTLSQWIQFKQINLKNFSPEEDLLRFDIFKKNLKRIEELTTKFTNGLITHQVAINKFADLTKEEFVQQYLKASAPQQRSKREEPRANRTTRQASAYMDWTSMGAVTPIKDQGFCASCWAFSTVGALEGQYFLRTGTLVSFSEQNLVDCSVDQTNNGCNGGWMANAFQYLNGHAITTQDVYPYYAQQQQCQQAAGTYQVSVQGYQAISPTEESLQQAVSSIGPIAAAIDATNLQFYAGGVYRDDECVYGQVNHGILVVGYGSEGGRDYWLVKNSWGPQWGENGYFKLIRNKNNQCNIATYAMYPIL